MTRDRRTLAVEPAGANTLSGTAHGSQMPVMRRSRSGVMVSAAAVVVGSTVGTALALRGEVVRSPVQRTGAAAGSASARAPASATSAGGAAAGSTAVSSTTLAGGAATAGSATASPSAAALPSAAAPSAAPDPRAAVVGQIQAAVMRFLLWSHDHPGARCPQAVALGADAADPWGRPLRIVCVDQPADQVVGLLSLGPDGLPGTADDVASWMLGPEVTDLLRGPPWGSVRGNSVKRVPAGPRVGEPGMPAGSGPIRATTPALARAPAAAAAVPAPNPRPSASAGAGSSDTDGDGIPDRR